MTEKPQVLSLEDIKRLFPPKKEVFSGDPRKQLREAEISRRPDGKILFVVPGSIKVIGSQESRENKP